MTRYRHTAVGQPDHPSQPGTDADELVLVASEMRDQRLTPSSLLGQYDDLTSRYGSQGGVECEVE